MKTLAALVAFLSLSLAACGPGKVAGATTSADAVMGPYKVLPLSGVFASAPQYKAGADAKAFMRERLDWAYSPGRPPLAVMDPEADLRLTEALTVDAVHAAEVALAGEGHKGARMIVAMDTPDTAQGELRKLAEENFAPAQIFAGGFEGTMGDSPEARANRDKLAKLQDQYPMARMFLGLALADQVNPADRAEGVRVLSGLHEMDPLSLQTVVSTLLSMQPKSPEADKAARQMLEAYAHVYPDMVAAHEPVMQGAMMTLADMLEQGRGGPTDVERAVAFYAEMVRESHPTCALDAVAALQRLHKPVPAGTGPACNAPQPDANPLQH